MTIETETGAPVAPPDDDARLDDDQLEPTPAPIGPSTNASGSPEPDPHADADGSEDGLSTVAAEPEVPALDDEPDVISGGAADLSEAHTIEAADDGMADTDPPFWPPFDETMVLALREAPFSQHRSSPLHHPGPTKRVFDPARAAAALRASTDSVESGQGLAVPQAGWLKRMAEEAHGGERLLGLGSSTQLVALDALEKDAPNFSTLIGLVRMSVGASLHTGLGLSFPPLLLLGPPGIGKSYVAARIAAILGLPFISLSMTTMTGFPFSGVDQVWKNPKIGLIAETLVASGYASPLIFLDELDKAFRISQAEDPLAPLHALLEPENARSFKDEFLGLSIACDALLWIATANSVEPLSPSLRDRFLILEIDPPTQAQMYAVIHSIATQATARFEGWFEEPPSHDIIARLTPFHPRRLRRILELAFTQAASEGQKRLAVGHIEAAAALYDAQEGRRVRMGFR